MGVVSLICTLIVIAIILIAVILSKNAFPSSTLGIPKLPSNSSIVYIVPRPRLISNKMPTIFIHSKRPKIWKSYKSELNQLLKLYRQSGRTTSSSTACDLRYLPSGGSPCYFPLEKISDNCTAANNFGYDSGNPCIALVFNFLLEWIPQPFNSTNLLDIPIDIRGDYNPFIVYVTCGCNVTTYNASLQGSPSVLDVQYSPYHGFPIQFLPSRDPLSKMPPLVMVQFIGAKPWSNIQVKCSVWARNIPKNLSNSVKFNIVIV